MNVSVDAKTQAVGLHPSEKTVQVAIGAKGAAAPSSVPRHRILLVDDERFILAALARLLRQESFEIVTAPGGAEALQLMEEQSFRLIISDQCMPGMTGLELLREVERRWPDTIRIILSGYTEVNTILAAINEGHIYKFITKPWNDQELKLHIRRALELADLEAENARMAREIAQQNERLQELNSLLEQRATDASTGLTFAQDLLETLGVGVLMIDQTGLIVGANRRANKIITSEKSVLIGMPAQVAFPEVMYESIGGAEIQSGDTTSGRLDLEGRKLQYRVNPLVADGGCRGSVITLWEEVA